MALDTAPDAVQVASHGRQRSARQRAGDQDAFAALYERHFHGIYDFAVRIVSDRDLAGDVVQNTFVKAWERFGEADVRSEKAWLYAVARNEAIDELRRRKRVVSGGDDESGPLYTAVDPARASDPELAAADNEMVELVWDAARGLSADEYSLLDMNLRRGLDADEIAEALGLQKGAVYTRLSRLKNALESSVVAMLLMRRGRRSCPELDALLSNLGEADRPTPDVRHAVERHLKGCAACGESRRRFASPAAIFSGLTPVPALPGMKESIWQGVASSFGGAPTGHAKDARQSSSKTPLIGAAAIAVLAGLALAATQLSDESAPPVPDSVAPADTRTIQQQRVDVRLPQDPAITGWSVEWTRTKRTVPDRTIDLPAGARVARSPVFTKGVMYFHFRARDPDGTWTAAQHQGPYRGGAGERVEP